MLPREVSAHTPQVAQLAGLDVALIALREKHYTLAPYADFATLVESGSGLHIGTTLDLRFGTGNESVLGLRAEYRRLGYGYLPRYFDAYYEIERYSYPGVKSPTKLEYASASAAANGALFEARLSLDETYSFSATFEGRSSGPSSVELGAEANVLSATTLSVLAARRGAFTAADLLDTNGVTWMLGELRSRLSEHVYAFALLANGYRVPRESERPAAVLEASVGLGGIAAF